MARRKKTAVDILLPEVSDPVKSGVEQSLQWEAHMERLATLANELEERRQEVALAEREKDLEYVDKLDRLLDTFLTAMAEVLEEENGETLKQALRQALEKGRLNQIKEMVVAMLGIPMDKREALLSFDETRQKKKGGRMKLEVVWKNNTGEQCGVRVEAD
jgi:hypothetical protein